MGEALLEVLVRHPGDVAGADEGGADRLHVVGEDDLSPEPALVSSVCRESDLPVFVQLRLTDSWTTTGGELARLPGLAEDYLALRLGTDAVGISMNELTQIARDSVEDMRDRIQPMLQSVGAGSM